MDGDPRRRAELSARFEGCWPDIANPQSLRSGHPGGELQVPGLQWPVELGGYRYHTSSECRPRPTLECRLGEQSREEFLFLWVIGDARRKSTQIGWLSPILNQVGKKSFEFIPAPATRPVDPPSNAWRAPDQNDGSCALRIGGSEHRGDVTTLAHANNCCRLRACSVHYGANVLRTFLERVRADVAVREPGATLIKQNEPSDRGNIFEKAAITWMLPNDPDVVEPTAGIDQVNRTGANTW